MKATSSKPNGAATVVPPPDVEGGFDVEAYRFTATLDAGTGGIRTQLTIPTGQPKRSAFFRVDPRAEMQFPIGAYTHEEEGKIGRETYLVLPAMESFLGEGKVRPHIIRVVICRPSILKLWAVPVPGGVGKKNDWTTSRWEGVAMAERAWVRLDVNESGTGYDVITADPQWPEPEWPTESLASMVQKAWRGNFVDNPDHVLLQYLRGNT